METPDKTFWIGKQDAPIGRNRAATLEALDSLKIKYQFYEGPDGHAWNTEARKIR